MARVFRASPPKKKKKEETLEDGTRVFVSNIHGNILSPMETHSEKSLFLSVPFPSSSLVEISSRSLIFPSRFTASARASNSRIGGVRVALVRDFK